MINSIPFSTNIYDPNNRKDCFERLFHTLKDKSDVLSMVIEARKAFKLGFAVFSGDKSNLKQEIDKTLAKAIRELLYSNNPVSIYEAMNINVRYKPLDSSIAHCLEINGKRVSEWQTSRSVNEFVQYIQTSVTDIFFS